MDVLSDNFNAPRVPHWLYRDERINFAGTIMSAISYGVVINLFFRCMAALLIRKGRGINLALTAHTMAMFSIVTIYTVMCLILQSISNIDNREFPGVDDMFPPGPLGYQFLIYSKAISIVPIAMFLMNGWLADVLLLYRCYVIYSRNRWAIAFPCLMYLASLAIGIVYIYRFSQPGGLPQPAAADLYFGVPYYSVSFALNALLTLMIIVRLVMVNRRIRNAMNAPVKVGGLYKAVMTSLIESCALYSVTTLLFIGFWVPGNSIVGLIHPVLVEFQTIAPFLITLRAANQSALTNVSIVSGDVGSLRFRSRGKSTSGHGTTLGRHPTSSIASDEDTYPELGVGIESTVGLHRDD